MKKKLGYDREGVGYPDSEFSFVLLRVAAPYVFWLSANGLVVY